MLQKTPIEDIERKSGFVLADAIRRMCARQVSPQGGYDGKYGVVKIFKEGELAQQTRQMSLF